ncbi:hypothetical protein KIW84_UN0789 [Lathyrus oleraceus]|nr:hypothetical protein KIW84_UN0789 [Pisum sativum]
MEAGFRSKNRGLWKCSETLESLNICWNRSPCKNWGTNSLCRPSYCPSRLSSHGTWPIAYGARSGRKIEDCGNAPRLWSPLTFVGIEVHAKIGDVFINQERKLGARRRSDTVLVSTINDADQGSADVAFRTPLAPYEKSKSLGSGGSMVARLKLKGIDGRAPPGVEPAA